MNEANEHRWNSNQCSHDKVVMLNVLCWRPKWSDSGCQCCQNICHGGEEHHFLMVFTFTSKCYIADTQGWGRYYRCFVVARQPLSFFNATTSWYTSPAWINVDAHESFQSACFTWKLKWVSIILLPNGAAFSVTCPFKLGQLELSWSVTCPFKFRTTGTLVVVVTLSYRTLIHGLELLCG